MEPSHQQTGFSPKIIENISATLTIINSTPFMALLIKNADFIVINHFNREVLDIITQSN